jgi:hypothetical protein
MKASELVAQIRRQIAVHGDLEIMLDCESILTEPGEVRMIDEAYLAGPLLIILTRQPGEASD